MYSLEKTVWSDTDFDEMGWHDAYIHAISFREDFEFLLDIDYILDWVPPKEDEEYYKFWIAPCTLIFENVYDLTLDLPSNVRLALEIDAIVRNNPRQAPNAAYLKKKTEYDWTIELHTGEINFTSVGYTQFIRRSPVLSDRQRFNQNQRGGISFDTSYAVSS
jgi:hypothetical protein